MQRIVLIAFITSIGACAAFGVYMIATGSFGAISNAVFRSLVFVAAASILGLASSAVWIRRTWHPLGVIGVILAPIALILTLIPFWGKALFPGFVWTNPRPWWYSKEMWVALGLAWVAAVAAPYIGLLGFARLHRRFLWVRRITIVLIAALGLILSIFIIDDRFFGRRFEEQGIAILVILAVFGTLTIPVLHRFSGLKKAQFVHTVALQLQITCPRCALSQELAVGRSACSQCALRFVIEIEENLCEQCGYALYRLESAACPECGTPILKSAAGVAPV